MTICPLWGCLLEIIVTVEDIRVVDGHHFVAANFDGQFLHDGAAQLLFQMICPHMADFDFKNPTFDLDEPCIDDDYSLDLPDAIIDPLQPRVQQELNMSGDNIQGEIREAEFEAQKKHLVDTFYKEVNRAYGLRPDSIDYDQFRIDNDGKTLYWTPGDKNISISTTRGKVRFLVLSTLASRYGVGGTDALRRSLRLTGYTRKGLGSSAVKALQQANKTLPSNLDIEVEDLPGMAGSECQSAEQVETTLTTIDDQPIDTAWVTQARARKGNDGSER